jgi:hypothetical protein
VSVKHKKRDNNALRNGEKPCLKMTGLFIFANLICNTLLYLTLQNGSFNGSKI